MNFKNLQRKFRKNDVPVIQVKTPEVYLSAAERCRRDIKIPSKKQRKRVYKLRRLSFSREAWVTK